MIFKLLKIINLISITFIIYIVLSSIFNLFIGKTNSNEVEIIQLFILEFFNISNEYIIGRNSIHQLLEIIRSSPIFLIILVIINSYFIDYDKNSVINNKLNLFLISFFLLMTALQFPFFYKWHPLISYTILIFGISGIFDIFSSSKNIKLLRILGIISIIYLTILLIPYLYSYHYFGGFFYAIKNLIILSMVLLIFLIIISFYYEFNKKLLLLLLLILVIVTLIERILIYNYFFKYQYNSLFLKPQLISSYNEIEVKSSHYLKENFKYSNVILVSDPYTLSIIKGLTGFNSFYSASNIEEMSIQNKELIRLILKNILNENCSKDNIKNFKKNIIKFLEDSNFNHSELSESIFRKKYNNIANGKYDENFFESLTIIVTPRTLEWINGTSSYTPINLELKFHVCNEYLYQIIGINNNFQIFRLNKFSLVD